MTGSMPNASVYDRAMPGKYGFTPIGAPRSMNSMSGTSRSRLRFDVRLGLDRQHRRRTGAEQIRLHHREREAIVTHQFVQRAVRRPPLPHQHAFQMILQVVADRERGDDRDAEFAQMIGRADAGEHQQLRRVERAAAQQHFARGLRARRSRRCVRTRRRLRERRSSITRRASACVSTVRFGRSMTPCK